MIIFDLDGTLADCEHRRHFVDPKKDGRVFYYQGNKESYWALAATCTLDDPNGPMKWKPNWKAFYESCDQDEPIQPAITAFDRLNDHEIIEIWSARCESVREKTLEWIKSEIHKDSESIPYIDRHLKMRPMGDYTPDEVLKERWLDEAIAEGKTIDFVFDDRPKVIRMWHRRGIFVFDVNQTGAEF